VQEKEHMGTMTFKRGWHEKTTGWTPARVNALEMMYCVYGYDLEEIAKTLNVTVTAIKNAIRVYGMKLTPQAKQTRKQRGIYAGGRIGPRGPRKKSFIQIEQLKGEEWQ